MNYDAEERARVWINAPGDEGVPDGERIEWMVRDLAAELTRAYEAGRDSPERCGECTRCSVAEAERDAAIERAERAEARRDDARAGETLAYQRHTALRNDLAALAERWGNRAPDIVPSDCWTELLALLNGDADE